MGYGCGDILDPCFDGCFECNCAAGAPLNPCSVPAAPWLYDNFDPFYRGAWPNGPVQLFTTRSCSTLYDTCQSGCGETFSSSLTTCDNAYESCVGDCDIDDEECIAACGTTQQSCWYTAFVIQTACVGGCMSTHAETLKSCFKQNRHEGSDFVTACEGEGDGETPKGKVPGFAQCMRTAGNKYVDSGFVELLALQAAISEAEGEFGLCSSECPLDETVEICRNACSQVEYTSIHLAWSDFYLSHKATVEARASSISDCIGVWMGTAQKPDPKNPNPGRQKGRGPICNSSLTAALKRADLRAHGGRMKCLSERHSCAGPCDINVSLPLPGEFNTCEGSCNMLAETCMYGADLARRGQRLEACRTVFPRTPVKLAEKKNGKDQYAPFDHAHEECETRVQAIEEFCDMAIIQRIEECCATSCLGAPCDPDCIYENAAPGTCADDLNGCLDACPKSDGLFECTGKCMTAYELCVGQGMTEDVGFCREPVGNCLKLRTDCPDCTSLANDNSNGLLCLPDLYDFEREAPQTTRPPCD